MPNWGWGVAPPYIPSSEAPAERGWSPERVGEPMVLVLRSTFVTRESGGNPVEGP